MGIAHALKRGGPRGTILEVLMISIILVAGALISAATGSHAADPGAPTEPGAYTWEIVVGFERPGGPTILTDMTIADDGTIVLVGQHEERIEDRPGASIVTPLAWSSADGGPTWTSEDLPGEHEAWMSGVSALGADVIAVAQLKSFDLSAAGKGTSLVWERAQDGTWSGPSKVKKAAFSDVASTAAGWVVVGSDAKIEPRALAWTPNDDGEWEPTRIAKKKGRTADRIAVSPEGAFVVAGEEEPGTRKKFFWRSADGANWESVKLPKIRDEHRLLGLVSTPAGFFASALHILDSTTVVWHSVDGAEWQQVLTEDDEAISAIGPTADGAVMFHRGGLVRHTTNGTDWTEGIVAELAGNDFWFVTSAKDGRIVGIGREWETDERATFVFVGIPD